MNDLIYFELNNWFSGRDYPPTEPFLTWVGKWFFSDDEWCKENKLVVLAGPIDMSLNWCIIATKSWVEENCPDLLSNKKYEYKTILHHWDAELGKSVSEVIVHEGAFSDFLRFPDEDGEIYGQFDWHFPEYKPENFGVQFVEDAFVDEL